MLKCAGKDIERKVLVASPLSYRRPDVFSEIVERRGWKLIVIPSQSTFLNPLQAYLFELHSHLKLKKYENMENMYKSVI